MKIRVAVGVLGGLLAIGLATAQEPKKEPTPTEIVGSAARTIAGSSRTANVVPSTFRAQLVVDDRFKLPIDLPDGTKGPDPRNRSGKMHCLVCEYGLSPVLAVFVRADITKPDTNAGLVNFLKQTDKLVAENRADKLGAFVMFLKIEDGPKLVTVKTPDGTDAKIQAYKEYPDDEKREDYVKEIKTFAGAVKAENVPFGLAPTGLHPQGFPSVKAFGISATTPVTVIIYNRMRLVQRWELKLDEFTPDKIGEILKAAKVMATGKEDTGDN